MTNNDDSNITIYELRKRTLRFCRSSVCGSTPFIPDSEFEGEACELTCNIKGD